MIDKLLAELLRTPDAKLAALVVNTLRPVQRGQPYAARLEAIFLDETARRHIARLKCEGGLCREPNDLDSPQFHGNVDAQAPRIMAAILNRATHKSHDKQVYSALEVMRRLPSSRFRHIAEARAAGSAAWRVEQ